MYRESVLEDSMIPVRLHMKAGVPQTKEINGEFIFIDQGRNLEVRWGGSILTRRKAGDVMKGGEYKRFTITSPSDQVVDLVVGYGDYNRLIVSGQINVASYVTTERGENLSLPMDVTKRVGLVDGVTVTNYDGEENLMAGHSIPAVGNTDHESLAWYNGSLYRIHNSGVIRYSDDGLTVAETLDFVSVPAKIQSADFVGAGITAGGQVYFWSKGNTESPRVFTFDLEEMIVSEITNSDMEGQPNSWSLSGRSAVGMLGTKLYYFLSDYDFFSATNKRSFAWYDVVTGNKGYFPITGTSYGFDISSGYWTAVDPEGFIIVSRNYTGDCFRFNPDGSLHDEVTFEFGSVDASASLNSQDAYAISPDRKVIHITGVGERRYYMESKTVYGTLYVQDGDDVATRRTRDLESPLAATPAAGGKWVVTAGLVKNVMSLLRGDFNPAGADYLDWLTAIKFTDRYGVTRRYDAGTETLFGRGITDEGMPIVIDGDLTLGILPEFFDQ